MYDFFAVIRVFQNEQESFGPSGPHNNHFLGKDMGGRDGMSVWDS